MRRYIVLFLGAVLTTAVVNISTWGGTITVNSTADPGTSGDSLVTLREAIEFSNGDASPTGGELALVSGTVGTGVADTILFDPSISGATIQPTSGLPALTDDGTFINGDIDGDGTPDVEIDGSAAGEVSGITITSAYNTIRGLVINRFFWQGVIISGQDARDNTIAGNYIGTDFTGTVDLGNRGAGIFIVSGAHSNTVGGVDSGDRNLISGNDSNGIYIGDIGTNGNIVVGNYIGTDITGTVGLGNKKGIWITNGAQNNIVGGSSSDRRNIISGNEEEGILMGCLGTGTEGNKIIGNFIGTDATGTVNLGNGWNGIFIGSGAQDNIIGGSNPGERNIISGNGAGIGINNSQQNTIIGNYIGTDITGTEDLGNSGIGISISNGAQNNTIGGSNPGERNLISGNNGGGVSISDSGTVGNIIIGNYIGTDVTGTVDLGNDWNGIYIAFGAQYNTVERNVVSGNGDSDHWGSGIGLWGEGAEGNIVIGNYIGTDAAGVTAIGNSGRGLDIRGGARNNTIGGVDPTERNIISGNGADGIGISDSSTTGNKIIGNYIGIDVSGTAELGNGWAGVRVDNGAHDNIIGGSNEGERNVISGNEGEGIIIWDSATTGNKIIGNYIGTDVNGVADIGNRSFGIRIGDAGNNIIGGSNPGEGNVISGNEEGGVAIHGLTAIGNIVVGNYIGTDATGASDLGNKTCGIWIGGGAKDNRIGGSNPGERNIISGNGGGIGINGAGTDSNTVVGNYIGTDITGTADLGNSGDGISITNGAQNNIIGGSNPGEGNLISGNGWNGITIADSSTAGNIVIGNYIGVDVNGTAALANDNDGINIINGASNNTIGGSTSGKRNIISGNIHDGIEIGTWGNPCTGNKVIGNYIGTDVTGTASIGNECGVRISGGAQGNTVGGSNPGEGNLISGNNTKGMIIMGSNTAGNVVIGNYIGTDVNGTTALPNNEDGLRIVDGAHDNIIGGSTPEERNIISGNIHDDGIEIGGWGEPCIGNKVIGNYIGTDVTGTVGLGNGNGVRISNSAQGNLIGGPNPGDGNLIAYNQWNGIIVDGPTTVGNTISRNFITDNGGAGIDNTNGGNMELSPPVIVTVTETEVSGTVDSTKVPDGSVVEIFNDPDREGREFLGSTAVSGGSFTFTGTIPTTGNITATVTDTSGNTSEFGYFHIPLTWYACWTETPPTLDGLISPGEYSDASPIAVVFNDPDSPPGIVAEGGISDSTDLSFVAYAVYDADNLYIAVDVTDDQIYDDSPDANWKDDCVEIYVDGDKVNNDVIWPDSWPPGNKEGFQLSLDVGGDAGGFPLSYNTDWFGAAGTRTGGYVVEFRIPLSTIDIADGPEEAHPSIRSSIGFTIQLNDDDDGGERDAVTWWDGVDLDTWHREDYWGRLYFNPPPVVWDHDVRSLSVLSPSSVAQFGGPIVPKLRVVNLGRNSETFDVTCRIERAGETVYTDVKTVTDLDTLQIEDVSFAEWTPAERGTYVLTFFTQLARDQDTSNDTLRIATGLRPLICDANWTWSPPTLDGTISPGEYDDAFSVDVRFDYPDSPPGIVALGSVSDSTDLSYKVYAMYDADNLYIAVDVTDDQIYVDSPDEPWEDDRVEVRIDGDEVSNDPWPNCNEEGFQIMVNADGSVGSLGLTYGTDWFAAAGLRTGGYIVEFRIPLSSIDMKDGPGETNPTLGSSVGFTVIVNDDDDGGNREAYTLWDGVDVDTWNREEDWGILRFRETSLAVLPNMLASIGDTVRVPVWIDPLEGETILSADIWLDYDPGVMVPLVGDEVDTSSTLLGGLDWQIAVNDTTGALRLAMTTTVDTLEDGDVGGTPLIWLNFVVSDAGVHGDSSVLSFKKLFLNGETAIGRDGKVKVSRYGDVDGDGQILSWDAHLVLEYCVGLTDLGGPDYPPNTLGAADVTGAMGVTAYDASWIMRKAVDPSLPFPAEKGWYPWSVPGGKVAVPLERVLALGDLKPLGYGEYLLPIMIDQMAGVFSGQLELEYDPSLWEVVEVEGTELTSGYTFASRAVGRTVHIAFAGAEPRDGAGEMFLVRLRTTGGGNGRFALKGVQLNEGSIAVLLGSGLQTSAPLDFRLLQNYPNPFNSGTTIVYEVPERVHVTIGIYGTSGKMVRKLVDGKVSPGRYGVGWDGRDDSGREVASGVYLCRMEAGRFVRVRKMILLK